MLVCIPTMLLFAQIASFAAFLLAAKLKLASPAAIQPALAAAVSLGALAQIRGDILRAMDAQHNTNVPATVPAYPMSPVYFFATLSTIPPSCATATPAHTVDLGPHCPAYIFPSLSSTCDAGAAPQPIDLGPHCPTHIFPALSSTCDIDATPPLVSARPSHRHIAAEFFKAYWIFPVLRMSSRAFDSMFAWMHPATLGHAVALTATLEVARAVGPEMAAVPGPAYVRVPAHALMAAYALQLALPAAEDAARTYDIWTAGRRQVDEEREIVIPEDITLMMLASLRAASPTPISSPAPSPSRLTAPTSPAYLFSTHAPTVCTHAPSPARSTAPTSPAYLFSTLPTIAPTCARTPSPPRPASPMYPVYLFSTLSVVAPTCPHVVCPGTFGLRVENRLKKVQDTSREVYLSAYLYAPAALILALAVICVFSTLFTAVPASLTLVRVVETIIKISRPFFIRVLAAIGVNYPSGFSVSLVAHVQRIEELDLELVRPVILDEVIWGDYEIKLDIKPPHIEMGIENLPWPANIEIVMPDFDDDAISVQEPAVSTSNLESDTPTPDSGVVQKKPMVGVLPPFSIDIGALQPLQNWESNLLFLASAIALAYRADEPANEESMKEFAEKIARARDSLAQEGTAKPVDAGVAPSNSLASTSSDSDVPATKPPRKRRRVAKRKQHRAAL
ncbi:hypothetical protein H0H87_007118 [Tephrocybe sp. NHM501043]|nr:hypothetical protein H0H87_007118 [Tephrocybe sp. NHM501043]